MLSLVFHLLLPNSNVALLHPFYDQNCFYSSTGKCPDCRTEAAACIEFASCVLPSVLLEYSLLVFMLTGMQSNFARMSF